MTLPKPKYMDLVFKTNDEFIAWLKEKTYKTIFLEDDGQDFLKFYVDKRGEILHTAPFQAKLWNGMIIDMKKIDDNIVVFKHSAYKYIEDRTLSHKIKKIEEGCQMNHW